MRTSFVVKEHERGFLLRDGRIVRVLEPGRHSFWDVRNRLTAVTFDVRNPLIKSEWADVACTRKDDLTDGRLSAVFAMPGEIVFVSFDGQPSLLVGPGKRLHLWSELKEVSVRKVEPGEEYRMTKADIAFVKEALPVANAKLFDLFEVGEHEIGLLFVDGKLEDALPPGAHGFWRLGKTIDIRKIDMRPTPVEISAQEILTKDRVSLRLTLTAFLKVVEPRVAALSSPNYADHIYRLVQFAIREAVASRTLDEVLNDRGAIDASLAERIAKAVAEMGVAVTELGIKDVILPGDMRELINKVVEAEKVAQANVIRRREETAATRSLLNTAKLMENNPLLLRLKELEALERVTEKIGRLDVHAGNGQGLDVLLNSLVSIKEQEKTTG